MNNEVFEEMQGAAGGAKAKLEKQARQLAYDTKYKVKQAMAANKGGKLDPAAVQKAYLAQLAKSPAPPAVKALAKKKLLGEEYVSASELAQSSVINVLTKVFSETFNEVEVQEEETVEEIEEEAAKEKKFYVKVTDKKTGNTYRRWATRSKISELRSNPNIASVEMTKYGEQDEREKNKGEQTASVKSGKGLDPVGQEDADVDNDGKPNDSNDKYIMKRRKAIGNAINKRKGGISEDFFSDWRNELFEKNGDSEGQKKLDVMKGQNKIIVSPEISEKMNLAKADMGDVIKDFRSSDAPQFKGKSKKKRQQMAIAAKLTAERGGQKLGEENETCPKCGKSPCECDSDPREMKTKMNLVKNKFRAMGLKMSQEIEGDQLNENPLSMVDRLGRSAAQSAGEAIGRNQGKKTGIPGGGTIGGVIGRARGGAMYDKATSPIRKFIPQSYEMSGEEILDEQGVQSTSHDWKSGDPNKAPSAPKLPPPSASTPKKPVKKQPHKPNPMGYAIRGNTFRVEESDLDGNQLDEGIPVAVGAGLVGAGLAAWKAHQGMKAANQIKKDAASGKGVAGSIQKATDAKNKALQMLNQGVEFESDSVIENIGSPIKLKPGSGLGGGVPVYPKDSKKPAPTGAQLPKLQNAGYEPEGEVIDERRREDKGKPRGPEPSPAFKAVSKMMGSGRLGVQPRGKKKVPGKKPPSAGQYGAPPSPAQRVAMRRAAAKRSQEMQNDTRGT